MSGARLDETWLRTCGVSGFSQTRAFAKNSYSIGIGATVQTDISADELEDPISRVYSTRDYLGDGTGLLRYTSSLRL